MASVRDLVANLRVFQGLGQWAPDDHEEALASKASCRIERPVHPRQPTFMIEFAMTHDRPKAPLTLRGIGGRCRSVSGHCPKS